MREKLNYLFILLAVGLFSACIEDVGRDNPLDPANKTNNLQISGEVLTFYHPRQAIAQAAVVVQPGDLIVISNQDGFFQFNNLMPGEYTIICRADGYRPDSANVTMQSSLEHTFLLDGLPKFDRISLTAHHRSRWFPQEEIYFIELETQVSDPDGIGDISSVTCEMSSLNFSDTLQPGIETGKFSKTLFDSDLPVTSVHQLIGREIYFIVEDDFKTKTLSDAKFLTRIIEQTPTLVAPVELQSIDPNQINFQWERILVPYSATLKIEIFRINLGIAFKTNEIKNIPITSKNYIYSGDLDPGDYFWTLLIVDEFGNSSSSKEGTFQIN